MTDRQTDTGGLKNATWHWQWAHTVAVIVLCLRGPQVGSKKMSGLTTLGYCTFNQEFTYGVSPKTLLQYTTEDSIWQWNQNRNILWAGIIMKYHSEKSILRNIFDPVSSLYKTVFLLCHSNTWHAICMPWWPCLSLQRCVWMIKIQSLSKQTHN